MTACMMPSEYGSELMLGSSPSIGHGFHASASSFSSDYRRCGSSSPMAWDKASLFSFPSSHHYGPQEPVENHRLYARTGSLRRSKKLEKPRCEEAPPLLHTTPAKSILRIQDLKIHEEDGQLQSPSTSPTKKKVSFADSLGLQLALIKVITERPECPPMWSAAFIERVTGGVPQDPSPHLWELAFSQPVADYVSYKSRLDHQNVALENAVLNESSAVLAGVVKVRNLSFHKRVTVKYTYDAWQTEVDIDGDYIPVRGTNSTYDLYDRFSFEIPLPAQTVTDKVEFCVRFICGGEEHWDNNDSRNFTVISFRPKKPTTKSSSKAADAYRMSMDSWSDFASWNDLETNNSPYW